MTEILGHTTERENQPVSELSMVSSKRDTRLSSGGPGNGSMWIAPTKSARDLLPDAHFMMSTVLRLGCGSNATGRLCALLKFRR